MLKQLLFLFMFAITLKGYTQTEKYKISSIAISIPIILNNSEATYYSLGRPQYPKGKGTSYGLNISYSRSIYKNLFAVFGVGYIKQAFGIERPFQFESPFQLLYYTQSYYYNSIQPYAGIGYLKKLNKSLFVKGEISYNWLNSFSQKYMLNKEYKTGQVNKKAMSIGRVINFNIGAEKSITKKISIGIQALIPVSTHWNNDEIFYKYDYSDDTQQIARNKFSLGINVPISYHF